MAAVPFLENFMRLTSIAARACAVPVLTCLLAPAVFAQVAASQPAAAAAAPAGPVRQLSLNDAVAQALEQNLDIQVERINPQVADENVALARAAFLPSLTSDLVYNNADTPPKLAP